MRVTSKMMTTGYLNNMNRNLNQMQKLQNQLTTGKTVHKPSDNPFVVARSMQLHGDIEANEQYNSNIKDTINWLDATDTALGQLTDTMQRIRELTVSAGNAAYGEDERRAIKDELNQRVEEIGTVLNTSFDGRYIFAGTRGAFKPVGTEKDENGNSFLNYTSREGEVMKEDTDNYKHQSELSMLGKDLNVEISKGVTMDYNVNVKNIVSFSNEAGEEVNMMNLLGNLINNIDSPNEEDRNKVIDENLKGITDTIANLLTVRAEVGAKQNRMESAQSKNEDESLNLKEVLSKTEDINFTEKSIESETMRTVYMASLQVSAKVIQPSLLDYIR
ncbi:MAG: flagellar hook-associated protein FlgL [Sarcina sp.]